jgi:hypothetical protein
MTTIINHTENNVFTIEPIGYYGGDEELRSIGVLPSIGHRKETGLGVLARKVLV